MADDQAVALALMRMESSVDQAVTAARDAGVPLAQVIDVLDDLLSDLMIKGWPDE